MFTQWLLLWGLVMGQRPQKFKFIVDGQSNNLVDSQNNAIPTALIPIRNDTATYVFGGLFNLFDEVTGVPNLNGVQLTIALECAVASLNANTTGLGLTNNEFFYRIINDFGMPTQATNAAVDLLDYGVPFVVGGSNSNAALPVAALYGDYGVPLISPQATAVSLSSDVLFPTFVRFIASDAVQAEAVADTFAFLNWTLVTPIYTNDAYGLSGQSQFTQQAQANRILLTCGRVIQPGQLNGIQDTVRCLSDSDSSVVLLWMPATDASNVIFALYNATDLSSKDLTFVATDSWSNYQSFESFSQGRFPLSYLEGTLGFTPEPGDQSEFRACFNRYAPGNNDIPNFTAFWEATFFCILTNDSSVPKCPANLAQRNVTVVTCRCDGSETLADIPATDKVGYVWDSVYAVGQTLAQIRNNCTALTEATGIDYCAADLITVEQFSQALRLTQFFGVTGYVNLSGII